MHRLLRKFRHYLALRNREKIWFVLLFFVSAIARAAILGIPFRRMTPYLGRHYHNAQLAAVVTEQQWHTACRIGCITELTSRYTPWQSRCLVQAVMARCLLGYYRIPYVLYLGVAKSAVAGEAMQGEKNDLMAHAWITVGSSIITGGEGHGAFTIVSTFVAPSILDCACHAQQSRHEI